MAKPGLKTFAEAESLSTRPISRVVFGIDLLLLLVTAAWGVRSGIADGGWFGWAVLATALASIPSTLGALGLRPVALSWRRRLGIVLVVLALLRNTPLQDQRILVALVVLWIGVVWIVLLQEGCRIAGVVVDATGEEGMGEDPSRHL